MKIRVAIAPAVLALGLLAGCSGDDGGSAGSLEELAAENAAIKAKLETLGTSLRVLENRVHELDRDNRTLEKMLSLAEQDLRSRLLEMVQQETGGGRRFAQRVFQAPAEPKPYLGFNAETNSAEKAKELELAIETGVVVTAVTEGAPAHIAGVHKGDVLQSVDDTPVATRDALVALFGQLKPGQECEFALLRGKESVKLKVKVGAR